MSISDDVIARFDASLNVWKRVHARAAAGANRSPSVAALSCRLMGRATPMVRLVIAVLVSGSCPLASAQEELPPELQPYRVSLSIAFDDVPGFPAVLRDRVREDVRRLIDRTLGERWSYEIADVAPTPRDAATLARLRPVDLPFERQETADDVEIGFPVPSVPDKALFATIADDGPGYVVSAREWDRLTDSFGPLRSNSVTTRDGLARGLVTTLISVFRPVAMIEESEEAAVPLILRASGIPTPDPAVGSVVPGMLFLPHLRGFDRDGNLNQVREIPFTLLRVAKTENDGVAAEVHSALRSPLGSRRGRIEAWAVAAPPAGGETRLTLVRKGDEVPLAGRIVEVRTTPFAPGEKPPPPEATLLTDRSGSVVLPADAKRTIVWLTIRSGTAVLMRFPLAPGIEPEIVLPLGDDVRRLDAEGRLAILSGELVETVAKRATLLATARAGARAGRYEEAEAAVAEAAELPDIAAFRRRIAAVATPAAKAAEEAGDRLTAARIRSLGRQAGELVDRYLKADALNATREEVEELKRTDPDRDANKG
ncbi:MAG: hypothetical protein WBC44_02330 [Planctomycetaceae bacterium]